MRRHHVQPLPPRAVSRWRSVKSRFAKRFVKDIDSDREAAPLKEPRLELVLEEPEPSQTGP
jgi:hypothetical protein